MSALLQMRLKEHLRAALAPLKLLGQTSSGWEAVPPEAPQVRDGQSPPASLQGDAQTAPQVFIGDLPPKCQNTPGRPVREVPCVVIIPLAGHIDVVAGAATSVATIALACCVYNPDREDDGDLTCMESDLANLVSAVRGALLPCAQGEPLAGRFVLVPDEKGKMLAWARSYDSPVPFASATITSRWAYKGWE